MSLERACVNCERCYALADADINDCSEVRSESNVRSIGESEQEKESRIEAVKANPATRRNAVYGNDQVYTARNEAMKALWGIIIHQNYRGDFMQDGDSTDVAITQKALEACRQCDYSSPKIVELVENLSKPAKE